MIPVHLDGLKMAARRAVLESARKSCSVDSCPVRAAKQNSVARTAQFWVVTPHLWVDGSSGGRLDLQQGSSGADLPIC